MVGCRAGRRVPDLNTCWETEGRDLYDGLTCLRDNERLTLRRLLHKLGEMGFGFINVDDLHGIPPRLSLFSLVFRKQNRLDRSFDSSFRQHQLEPSKPSFSAKLSSSNPSCLSAELCVDDSTVGGEEG